MARDETRAAWTSAAVAVAAGVLLELCRRPAPVIGDAARDFLYARDCVEQSRCPGVGASMSALGLKQAALWPAFISAIELGGGTAHTVQSAVIALQALSVGALHRALRVWVSRDAAVAAALAFTAFLVLAQDQVLLWNPSLLALPAVLSVWALLILAATGSVEFAAVTAFGVVATMEAHVGAGGSLVPAAVVLTAAAARRPAQALGTAAITALCVLFFTAHDAVIANSLVVARPPGVWLVLAALGACALAGLAARPWFANASKRARFVVLGALLVAPPVFAQVWLHATKRAEIEPRYLYPVAIVGAAALGVVAASAVKWAGTFVSLLRCAPGSWAALLVTPLFLPAQSGRIHADRDWSFEDLPVLSAAVGSRSFSDLERNPSGPRMLGCDGGPRSHRSASGQRVRASG